MSTPAGGKPHATQTANATEHGKMSAGAADSTAAAAQSNTVPVDSVPDGSLIDTDKLAGLRLRWTDIQTSFVDDPRQCVQAADLLVSDVVDQLTAGFAATRTRLEQHWNKGEDASTEDLRVALQRYRQFFDHLLEM